MIQYEAATKGLGVAEMINTLMTRTWKAQRMTGIEGLIQIQTGQILLTYLLAASVNDNNSFVVKSVLQTALKDLKTFIDAKLKTATDPTYKGHLLLALERMKEPEKAKPTIHREIPPGHPLVVKMRSKQELAFLFNTGKYVITVSSTDRNAFIF